MDRLVKDRMLSNSQRGHVKIKIKLPMIITLFGFFEILLSAQQTRGQTADPLSINPEFNIAGDLCIQNYACFKVEQVKNQVKWLARADNVCQEGVATYVRQQPNNEEFVGRFHRKYVYHGNPSCGIYYCQDSLLLKGQVTDERTWSYTVELLPGTTTCDGELENKPQGFQIKSPAIIPDNYTN
jgi:hypothetical protein